MTPSFHDAKDCQERGCGFRMCGQRSVHAGHGIIILLVFATVTFVSISATEV